MPADPHAVQILVDGSCRPNEHMRSGYGGIVFYPDETSEEVVFQGFLESTINRMELGACIAALVWVKEAGIGKRFNRVQISSDSQWVIDNIPRAPYWKKDKWRNREGRPLDNSDLWNDFLSARSKAGVRVDFLKAKGKSTPRLKLVDQLAKKASSSHPKIDRGLIVGKVGRAKLKGSAKMFPAAGQTIVVHVVRSRTVGKSKENRFVFEQFDETTASYVAKYFAYCTPETGVKLHRRRGFRVEMNDNPKYPQILKVLDEVLLPRAQRKKKSLSTV